MIALAEPFISIFTLPTDQPISGFIFFVQLSRISLQMQRGCSLIVVVDQRLDRIATIELVISGPALAGAASTLSEPVSTLRC